MGAPRNDDIPAVNTNTSYRPPKVRSKYVRNCFNEKMYTKVSTEASEAHNIQLWCLFCRAASNTGNRSSCARL